MTTLRPKRPLADPETSSARALTQRSLLGGAARLSSRSAVALAALVVVAWLMLVFGSALAKVDTVQREARDAAKSTADLNARLDAGRREVALIQTDAFLEHMARAFGMGDAGERPFALEEGAPTPARIVPLGTEPVAPEAPSPFEEWLDLLFG